MLAACTPEVDKFLPFFQELGERFLYVRWNRAGGIEAGLGAMQQNAELDAILRAAVQRFLAPVMATGKLQVPEVPQEMRLRLAALVEFVVRARANVPRDSYRREIEGEPVIESNTRLPQQLAQVVRGWAALCGHPVAGEEEFSLAARTAFDSIPPIRNKVIRALKDGRSPHTLGLPSASVNRAMGDRTACGLVRGRNLTPQAKKSLDQARCDFP